MAKKENKTMDQIHKELLKKYHTLCTLLGLDDEAKRAILTSWGVESSRDLSQHQLIDICAKLSEQVDEKQGTARLDKLRKQVIAAIGGWLRQTGQPRTWRRSKVLQSVPAVTATSTKYPARGCATS